MRRTIPQWNLLSRVMFRIFSSGADITDRPHGQFENGTLTLTFESSFLFDRCARMCLQYQGGNTVGFTTSDTTGTMIVSRATFNSTPVVHSLPDGSFLPQE